MTQDEKGRRPGQLLEKSPPPMVPPDMPVRATPNTNGNGHDGEEDEEREYLVDIDTHQALLVRATTPETAVAKAVLYTIESDDEDVTEVARDVHTCAHSGISDNECDHEDEEGAD